MEHGTIGRIINTRDPNYGELCRVVSVDEYDVMLIEILSTGAHESIDTLDFKAIDAGPFEMVINRASFKFTVEQGQLTFKICSDDWHADTVYPVFKNVEDAKRFLEVVTEAVDTYVKIKGE